ncbi:hypothetical protein [Azospirillum thermophilum]|uniref:Uncharacterized protein n=1 Tax=Azospirillum thermophilum TaxID=2202148 RepID=A0A2S2CPA3_9PROT|nr:hypothetical protein [Azospirillum thermophilum]AWK86353.1 hypothetical protein DEW08_08965 [Azospirillum thermophilum]
MSDPRGSDPRKDLLRQIRAIREELDPKLVERAKLAVFGKVPYDRDNARAAVAHFLAGRKDGEELRAELERTLGEELPDVGASGPEPIRSEPVKPDSAARHPLKPRRIGRIV